MNPTSSSTTQIRRSIGVRLLAGTGLALTIATLAGGAAFAGSPGGDDGGDPVIPIEFVADGVELPQIDQLPQLPQLPDGPVIPDLPEIPELPEIPDFTPPEIPDFTLPEIPDDTELPDPCPPWDPSLTEVVHADPVDNHVTVSISYLSDAHAACDTTIVVHSIRLDDASNPIGLLAEEHLTLDELGDLGGSTTITVPIDPCHAQVLTNADGFALAITTYGDGTGCTDDTDPTEPTVPTDSEVPSDETVPKTVVTGQLPATGSATAPIALLGFVFIATGLSLACAARGMQVRSRR